MGTSSEIIVRRMTAADISTLCETEIKSFKTSWKAETFQQCLASPAHLNLVAELDKKIVAYSVLQLVEGKFIGLLRFAVVEEFRRRYFGKNFLEFLINLAPQLRRGQILAMLLHVNTKNVAAIRLYESCGFKVFERIENFYANDNENAFIMERKI